MQKKTLVVAISLAMSSPLYADVSFYVGGAAQQTKLETDYGSPISGSFNHTSDDDTATALKLFGGAKRQLNNWFYGVEVAYEDGSSKVTTGFSPFSGPNGQRGELEDDYSLSVSLLGGYKIANNTHLIGRVGYVRTDFDFRALEGSTLYSSGDDTLSGVQYGIGVEHNFSDKVGMRVEYSRSDYSGDINAGVVNGTGDLAEFDDVSRDSISIGVFATF